MDLMWTRGTTIRIISTTRAIGKRVLSTKCEVRDRYDDQKRVLLPIVLSQGEGDPPVIWNSHKNASFNATSF